MIDIKSYRTKEERIEAVKNEFLLCKNDFLYYLNNYAKIRHPNAGVISMKAFDFQLDVAIPVSKSLIAGRSEQTITELSTFNHGFDYKKWRKEYLEMNLDLLKLVPNEVHEHYTATMLHPQYKERIDQIILKSRQTGISTIFQQLNIWHTNFHSNVVDLIVSMTDREAKKYLNDVITSYKLLPGYLRAKQLKSNDHELWTSMTGDKAHKSVIQALPPTADAGRSYSPNFVVLDEFAAYRSPAEVWTSISMSVSGGGIIVIISTPKGVGNLFHSFWTSVSQSLGVYIENNPLADSNKSGNSNFKPYVLHWSQLPEAEFTRRGFANGVAWYNHMRGYIALQSGEKAVAQELDLKFLSSGDTVIPGTVLETLYDKSIEKNGNTTILKKDIIGLKVFEAPEIGYEYTIGCDVSEGVGRDYSTLYVFKIPDIKKNEFLPKVVAEYANNLIMPQQFSEIVFNTCRLYNGAYINAEKNNAGHSMIDKLYDLLFEKNMSHLLMNGYDVNKMKFKKNEKGWDEKSNTRQYLLANMQNFIIENSEDIEIPSKLYSEFLTFVNGNRRWEHSSGYHDDLIFAYALGLLAISLLAKYKDFLKEGKEHNPGMSEIDADDFLISSDFLIADEQPTSRSNKMILNKDEINIEALQSKLSLKSDKDINNARPQHLHLKRNFISSVIVNDDESSYDDFESF